MIPSLSEALAERGYDTLTAVQEAVSAPETDGRDLLVSAQTGSGKTVGLGLAIAPTLLGAETGFGPAATPLALVVAPTRELAMQVKQELGWLYAKTGARIASCVGGMDIRQERRALERGAHIVVGTPGRLRDHIERSVLDLGDIRAIVLDEADEMLDLGFREDLEFMLEAAPEQRRTLMFSATVPPMISKLAAQFQDDALRISTISKGDQHADITYQALRVAEADAENAIFNLLRFHHDEGAIVFANTRAAVNHLLARLANRGFATVSLSGELTQGERTHALQAMRDGRARVCVATDVAARGIDLPNLSLVIHADLPSNTESLLHRSGRTGRAGRKGISALIVPPRATKKAERLLKWAKISAEWTQPPSAEEILRQDEARLLSDDTLSAPLQDDETAFAARLLDAHSPEAVAAAYLRLFRQRNAAPEELAAPDAKPVKAARAEKDFGPSRWARLSVGRAERAEARWLLPLLCRVGQLDKSDIGAIRVRDEETFVELKEASVEGFVAVLDDAGTLEDGITASLLDGVPDLGPPPARAPRGGDKGQKPRPAPGPRGGYQGKPSPAGGHADKRRPSDPSDSADRRPARAKPGKPKWDDSRKPARPGKPARADAGDSQGDGAKPARAAGPARTAPHRDKPGKPAGNSAADYSAKPRRAPEARADERKPRGKGPSSGDGYKKDGPSKKDGPYRKDGGFKKDENRRSTWAEGRPAKGSGKPSKAGQTTRTKPGAPAKANAHDTSKRFSPKGAGAGPRKSGPKQKPSGPRGKGGFDSPKRPKR